MMIKVEGNYGSAVNNFYFVKESRVGTGSRCARIALGSRSLSYERCLWWIMKSLRKVLIFVFFSFHFPYVRVLDGTACGT